MSYADVNLAPSNILGMRKTLLSCYANKLWLADATWTCR